MSIEGEESVRLPTHYEVEPELREQLSARAGHQRCIEGHGELLLVVHEVPRPGVPEREAIFFWRRHEGRWTQPGGPGLGELGELLGRYERVIDRHEQSLEAAERASALFPILRHAAPLARSSRNLVHALEQALAMVPDDRQVRSYRDRARELERAAELLQQDARLAMENLRAEREERQAASHERLGRILFRLNLLAGFFLPLVALGGLLGMNVELPGFLERAFWLLVLGGAAVGLGLLALVALVNRGRSDEEAD